MKAKIRSSTKELTNELLSESNHICLIYENEEQRKKIVADYLSAGIRNGEVVRYFNDTTPPEVIREWFSNTDTDLSKSEEDGAFLICKAESAYCPKGCFEPQKMINNMIANYDKASKANYRGSRATGEMSWALRGIKGAERLIEYEALLNSVHSTFPHSGMCQYDARLFDGATLFKVLRVHPFIIAQGQIVRNPYYVKTAEFLGENISHKH